MSQNAHRLLLFFDDQKIYKDVFRLFKSLEQGNSDQIEKMQLALSVSFEEVWNNNWFNQEVIPEPTHLCIDFETSARDIPPFQVIESLFDIGIIAATIETFYDQVGEFQQLHFMDKCLVDKASLYERYPRIKSILANAFEAEDDELDDDGYERPKKLSRLIKDEAKNQKEAAELVNAISGLSKVASESGTNPFEAVKSALVVSAAIRGLAQALLFGVMTILLFKGIWLWICLTIVAVVALPIYQVMQLNSSVSDDDDSFMKDDGANPDKQEKHESEGVTC
ncbi:Uncharacterised protein [BD1-7 clade bacterium]|nr:Uncharacterised protein [BD1-7 clade bacterium]